MNSVATLTRFSWASDSVSPHARQPGNTGISARYIPSVSSDGPFMMYSNRYSTISISTVSCTQSLSLGSEDWESTPSVCECLRLSPTLTRPTSRHGSPGDRPPSPSSRRRDTGPLRSALHAPYPVPFGPTPAPATPTGVRPRSQRRNGSNVTPGNNVALCRQTAPLGNPERPFRHSRGGGNPGGRGVGSRVGARERRTVAQRSRSGGEDFRSK